MDTLSRLPAFTREWILPVSINEKGSDDYASERVSVTSLGDQRRWNSAIRVMVFLICLMPFLALVRGVVTNSVGPDPAEHVMHVTGEWVLRLLALVLLATPLSRWGLPRLARYRRMLGLYVWFYATLHLLVFAQVYIGWSGEQLTEELVERPYVMVGFVAWLILVPLGITSARAVRRKMGRRWQQLHRLTYAVAVLGWLHLLWLSRSDVREVFVYGLVYGFLFTIRVRYWLRRSGSAPTYVSL